MRCHWFAAGSKTAAPLGLSAQKACCIKMTMDFLRNFREDATTDQCTVPGDTDGAESVTSHVSPLRGTSCPSSLDDSKDDHCTCKSNKNNRTIFFNEVRWWCWMKCQRWLEESAFRIFLIMHHPTLLLVLCASAVFRIAGACSSRSTPRPRPPTPTMRPNITFQTYACPEAYAKWYCLNGATCFSVKIGESILYNCECADGFVGQRCEFKDLEGSYLASRQQVMIETASIAGGVTLLILILIIVFVAIYVHYKRKRKEKRLAKMPATQMYQPFGSFRESEHNGLTRPLTTNDPECGHSSHGEVHPVASSSAYCTSNRARTLQ